MAQTFARAPVNLAERMQTHHGIHPARAQRGQIRIRTKTPVRQHHLAGLEDRQEFEEQPALTVFERAFDPCEQGTAGQTEARHQLDDGKTAAGLLF